MNRLDVATQQQWASGWLQLGVSIAKTPSPVFWAALAETVDQARRNGWLQRWSLQAKEPGLRIRMQPAPACAVRLLTHLQHMVAEMERSAEVRSHRYGYYEPEMIRFGGPWGLELFWDDADRDSDLAVAHHLLGRGVQPRHVLALGAARDIITRATSDGAEDWDIWARVAPPAEMVGLPPANAATLLSASADLCRLGGILPPPLDDLVGRVRQANTRTCDGLSALAGSGLLTIGPRAWLAALLPFRLNRWGLGHHTPWAIRAVADAGTPHA